MHSLARRGRPGTGPCAGHPSWPLVVLLGAVSLLGGGAASALAAKEKRARAGDSEPRKNVKQHTQEGMTALAAKDFVTARRALAAAYRLAPLPAQGYQLGQLALAEGRIIAAQDFLRRFLHDTNEPDESPARKEAQRVLALPAPPSGEVSIVGDRNVVVLIDDHVVGVIPLSMPLLLSSGEHRVVLEWGAQHLEDQVTVLAGRLSELRGQFHVGVVVVTLQPALLLVSEYPQLTGEPLLRLEHTIAQDAAGVQLGVQQRQDALVQAPKLAECPGTPRCHIELAIQNLVQYVLTLKAVVRPLSTYGKTADWHLETALLDAAIGDVAAALQKECLGCTAERVVDLLTKSMAEVLKEGIHRPSGSLVIASTPSGAEVVVGQHAIGVTPLRRPYWAGPLALTLRRAGYRSQPASLMIVSGQTASLQLTLAPGSDIVVRRHSVTRLAVLPRPHWRLGVGGAALAVGAGLFGLGISGLTVKDQCVPGSYVGSECQNLYATNGVGAGLGIGGALFLAGGVVLLALPGRRHLLTVTLDATAASVTPAKLAPPADPGK